MLLVHGNHEAFTHNTKLVADLQYIQQRYNINGGGTADPDFAEELKASVKELEDYEREHGFGAVPAGAKEYFKRMYNVDL